MNSQKFTILQQKPQDLLDADLTIVTTLIRNNEEVNKSKNFQDLLEENVAKIAESYDQVLQISKESFDFQNKESRSSILRKIKIAIDSEIEARNQFAQHESQKNDLEVMLESEEIKQSPPAYHLVVQGINETYYAKSNLEKQKETEQERKAMDIMRKQAAIEKQRMTKDQLKKNNKIASDMKDIDKEIQALTLEGYALKLSMTSDKLSPEAQMIAIEKFFEIRQMKAERIGLIIKCLYWAVVFGGLYYVLVEVKFLQDSFADFLKPPMFNNMMELIQTIRNGVVGVVGMMKIGPIIAGITQSLTGIKINA